MCCALLLNYLRAQARTTRTGVSYSWRLERMRGPTTRVSSLTRTRRSGLSRSPISSITTRILPTMTSTRISSRRSCSIPSTTAMSSTPTATAAGVAAARLTRADTAGDHLPACCSVSHDDAVLCILWEEEQQIRQN